MTKFSPGLIFLLGALAALGAAAIDMYLPSLPSIQSELGGVSGNAQFTLSSFFIGLGVGQLFYGPISDALGRRKVLVVGLLLYCLGSLFCFFAGTMMELVIARFFQALGAAAGGVISRAMVRDVFNGEKAAQAQSFINLAFSLTPLMAPLVGGYLLIFFGWRSTFLALFLFGIICLLILVLKIPETLPIEKRNSLRLVPIVSGYKSVLRNSRSMGSIIAGALAFSCMFTYFAASPFIYIDLFKIPDQYYGFLFGLNVLGIIATSFINARTVLKYGPLVMLRIGVSIMCTGSIALVGMSNFQTMGIIGIIIPLFFVIGSIGFIGANAISIALEAFGELAGTTASLFGFTQMTLGAFCGFLVGFFHDGTAVPMGVIILILAFTSLAFLTLFVSKVGESGN